MSFLVFILSDLLKVMSIVHHLESRSLVFRTRLSEADIFSLVEGRMRELDALIRRSGAPVKEVYGSRKSRDSLVSKLLSRRDTFASAVFDKFRYRIVVNEQKDLLPAVAFLLRHFIPFNYVVPGQSGNNLLDASQYLDMLGQQIGEMDGILSNYREGEGWGFKERRSNEFSGSSYKMINFICDIPVRLDSFLTKAEIRENGRIGFVLVELQIVDSETNVRNEWGPNSHAAYKERRKSRVLERLRWGGRLKPSQRGSE